MTVQSIEWYNRFGDGCESAALVRHPLLGTNLPPIGLKGTYIMVRVCVQYSC